MSQPRKIKPQALKALLSGSKAREAFNKVSALCANWETWQHNGTIYLRADKISTTGRVDDFPVLVPVTNGFGNSYDEAVIKYLDKLVKGASKTGATVIVQTGDDRKEYRYDKKSRLFTPYTTRRDMSRPGKLAKQLPKRINPRLN